MRKRYRIILIVPILFLTISCEGPETVVTDIVMRDGSVLRKAEMSNSVNNLKLNDFSIPVDSTWSLSDSIVISAEGDTTWFLMAEKLFPSAEKITEAYGADTGKNSMVERSAHFSRKFRWFTTVYYFEESCRKSLQSGYAPEQYISQECLSFMHLPQRVADQRLNGPDSLAYSALKDSLEAAVEKWSLHSVISDWIETAGTLCTETGKDSLAGGILRSHESEFCSVANTMTIDSACITILGEEMFSSLQTELDSAEKVVEKRFDRSFSFSSLTLMMMMPGKIRSTNGFDCGDGSLAWPVNGDQFLTADYIMYAESGITNYWAIAVTVLLSGLVLIILYRGKGNRAG